jgi:hypothetical protein
MRHRTPIAIAFPITPSKYADRVYIAKEMVQLILNIGYLSKSYSHSLDRRAPSCAQTTSELYVFLLYGDTLGVDSAKVCVVEEVDKEGFGGFL